MLCLQVLTASTTEVFSIVCDETDMGLRHPNEQSALWRGVMLKEHIELSRMRTEVDPKLPRIINWAVLERL
jgi:hypothetical protein